MRRRVFLLQRRLLLVNALVRQGTEERPLKLIPALTANCSKTRGPVRFEDGYGPPVFVASSHRLSRHLTKTLMELTYSDDPDTSGGSNVYAYRSCEEAA